MNLHPWPQRDRARPPVVWKTPFAVAIAADALLIDTGAVPLCFLPESDDAEPASAADTLAGLQCHHDAALARIRLLEALLRDQTRR